MKEDYSVSIIFKNKDMEVTGEKNYGLQEYCLGLKDQLLRVILDIEDVFYDMEGYKRKEEWGEEHTIRFQHLRHKILDAANDVGRLPNNMCYRGKNINTMSTSEFIKMLVDN